MSSINTHYTLNYSQPEEYRLSHDSVFLARQVYEQLCDVNLAGTRVLDICAGSGVVGMDFLYHRRNSKQTLPEVFDFLEVQNIYQQHFSENCNRLGTISCQLNFLNRNYNDLLNKDFTAAYDLIISNPPYFRTSQGKLSPSEFKNRCRFFIDSDLQNLIFGIYNSLNKTGQAYIILRDLSEHGCNVVEEVRQICDGKLKTETLQDIRGAYFIRMLPI